MTKNSFFILVIIVVVGFSIWFTRFGAAIKETQSLVVEQQEKTQQVLRRQASQKEQNRQVSAEKSDEIERLGKDIEALSLQLENETQKLTNLRSRLDALKQQLNTKAQSSYGRQISDLIEEIQELSDTLKEYQWSESDLNRQVNLASQEQSAAYRLSIQQMEQNITQQEEQLKANQNELYEWNFNNTYTNEKEARVRFLEESILNQTQTLNEMKTQRAEIINRSYEQSKQILDEARSVASELNEDRTNVQEQMSSIRGEIRRLEDLQSQTRMSQISLSTQVLQAEKNIQGQQETIKTIEEIIRQKQDAIKRLE